MNTVNIEMQICGVPPEFRSSAAERGIAKNIRNLCQNAKMRNFSGKPAKKRDNKHTLSYASIF